MHADVARRLASFEPVALPPEGEGLDTAFADDFLRAFTRLARAQMKTQQAVELSVEDVRRALQEQQGLVEEVREQRRAAERKSEQLLRFILEVVDVVLGFHKSSRKSASTELRSVADTMLKALGPNMEKIGLVRIPALGQVPDALYHFVLSTRAADDEAQRDRIVEVVREGYLLDGEIIRKADVIVGK